MRSSWGLSLLEAPRAPRALPWLADQRADRDWTEVICEGPRPVRRGRWGRTALVAASAPVPEWMVFMSCFVGRPTVLPRATMKLVSDLPYRVAGPRPPDPYMAAWAVLRRRRAFSQIASMVFVAVLVPTVVGLLSPPSAEQIAIAVAASFAAIGVMLSWLSLPAFACPHCRGGFFRSSVIRVGLSDRCAGCGIKVGTPKGEVLSDTPGKA
jgi:hypothetical protein